MYNQSNHTELKHMTSTAYETLNLNRYCNIVELVGIQKCIHWLFSPNLCITIFPILLRRTSARRKPPFSEKKNTGDGRLDEKNIYIMLERK